MSLLVACIQIHSSQLSSDLTLCLIVFQASLPWSDTAPSKETSVINAQLAKMNQLGYLTINSQPA